MLEFQLPTFGIREVGKSVLQLQVLRAHFSGGILQRLINTMLRYDEGISNNHSLCTEFFHSAIGMNYENFIKNYLHQQELDRSFVHNRCPKGEIIVGIFSH
jgi:hypothetical protein